MIKVNGAIIEDGAIAREMQHHPAPSQDKAEREAATALVIRELLLQRVNECEIGGATEDQRIANLIDDEVRIPEPTDEEIERYYRRNTLRFMTSPLYEVAHIFFPARQDDEARSNALAMAQSIFAELEQQPRRFAELAMLHSACSSKDQGGSLGQVTKGDTNPELERALATAEVGSITIVRSRHGIHVMRLDRRVPGRQLPLETAREWIASHLRKMSKRRAVAQYLQLLAASANISGIDIAAADSPLVQ